MQCMQPQPSQRLYAHAVLCCINHLDYSESTASHDSLSCFVSFSNCQAVYSNCGRSILRPLVREAPEGSMCYFYTARHMLDLDQNVRSFSVINYDIIQCVYRLLVNVFTPANPVTTRERLFCSGTSCALFSNKLSVVALVLVRAGRGR